MITTIVTPKSSAIYCYKLDSDNSLLGVSFKYSQNVTYIYQINSSGVLRLNRFIDNPDSAGELFNQLKRGNEITLIEKRIIIR